MEALPRHRKRNLVLRALVGAVAVGLLSLLLWWTGEGARMWNLFSDREQLQRVLNRSGAVGPLLYVALVVLQAVVAPLPAPVLAVAGGYCFGPFEGFLLTWIGALLGGVGCFGISRIFGRQLVSGSRRAEKFDSYVEAHGAVLIFVLRLIPLVSFDAISYGAGLSGIRFRSFLLATAFGMAPGTFVFVYLGGASSGWGVSVALIGLACVTAVAYYIYSRRFKGKLGRVK